jgi:alcohol dehydrogenase class IV
MASNVEAAPERYAMVADAMGIAVHGISEAEAAMAAVQAVKDLKKAIGLTQTLRDFNVPNDANELRQTVDLAASDSQISYNPRYLEDSDILELLLTAY